MNKKPDKVRKKEIGITIAVVVMVVLLLLYGSIDPEDGFWGKFFPKCPVKVLTGLQCPSCGLQRAAHRLLQGDIMGAWSQNWFLAVAAVYLGGLLLTKWLLRPESEVRRFFWGTTGCTIFIVLYLVWFVVRNVCGL